MEQFGVWIYKNELGDLVRWLCHDGSLMIIGTCYYYFNTAIICTHAFRKLMGRTDRCIVRLHCAV